MVRGFRLFRPILAGANAHDRIITCLGAIAGITLVALGGMLVEGPVDVEAWIFAPVGASAVLVFAVPASPLTQPWPVIGGLILSAAAGIAAGVTIGSDALAAGLAVGLAIAVMSVTRTLHPPGGAAAITGALAATAGYSAEVLLPLIVVAFDAVAIVLFGWVFHRLFSGHSYPHVVPVVATETPMAGSSSLPVRFGPEDIDSVLARIDDSFDISRGDLEAILRAVEDEALHRELDTLEHTPPASQI